MSISVLYANPVRLNKSEIQNLVGAQCKDTTRFKEIGINEVIKREKMMMNLRRGQVIIVKNRISRETKEMTIINNNGMLVVCREAVSGRITTIDRGGILSKQILIKVINPQIEGVL